jgi:hypothetical protein
MNYETVYLPILDVWGVAEKATGHLIRIYDDKVKATKLCQFLNNGGGFNGWTPAFICDTAHYALFPDQGEANKSFKVK